MPQVLYSQRPPDQETAEPRKLWTACHQGRGSLEQRLRKKMLTPPVTEPRSKCTRLLQATRSAGRGLDYVHCTITAVVWYSGAAMRRRM